MNAQWATAAFFEQVRKHAPETPGQAWRCPACGTARPGDAFYCDHERKWHSGPARDVATGSQAGEGG